MKKNLLSILLLAAAPALALASGDHAGGHHEHQEKARHEHGAHGHDEHHEALIGRPGERAKVTRTIRVSMADTMRFEPADMTFRAGETVRFAVSNHGKIRHEMVLGTMDELQEHLAMMRKNPNMHHQDANMISLAPGKSGEMIWQFTRPGNFDFACLIPGHMEAGMTGKITVR